MKAILLALIRFYRKYISPARPPCCRFVPTCSAYALEAIEVHGALKGGFLALKRIVKCNPFRRQETIEYDPVPPKRRPWRRKAYPPHKLNLEETK